MSKKINKREKRDLQKFGVSISHNRKKNDMVLQGIRRFCFQRWIEPRPKMIKKLHSQVYRDYFYIQLVIDLKQTSVTSEHFSQHLLIKLCMRNSSIFSVYMSWRGAARRISPKRKLWILAATCSILESYIRCINTPATLNSTTENDKYNKNVKF